MVEQLGRIGRLQVQVARVKRGERPHRWYDPARIRRVPEVLLTEEGVVGRDGDEHLIDNHHVDHPDSRNRGDNGISLGVTGHYRHLRARYGDHLVDGIAGENLILEHETRLALDDLADGLTILADGGRQPVVLAATAPIEPCVEFSRLVVGAEAEVREPLQSLRGGMRGFKLALVAGGGAPVAEGDPVLRGRPD